MPDIDYDNLVDEPKNANGKDNVHIYETEDGGGLLCGFVQDDIHLYRAQFPSWVGNKKLDAGTEMCAKCMAIWRSK